MFSLLIGGGGLLGHLYLYRLVRQLAPDGRWRLGLGAFLVLMTALLVLRRPIRDVGPQVERIYELVAYSWIAFALCTILVLLAADLVRLGLALTRRVRRTRQVDPTDRPRSDPRAPAIDDPVAPSTLSRRGFVTRALPGTVLAGGSLTVGYASLRAFTAPEVSEVVVKLPGLPRQLEGLTIVQVTDVHVGPFIRRPFVKALVDQVNALRPDVVAVTGDLVDGDVRTLGDAVSALAELRARYGTHFVTGNHEYYSGVDQWVTYLEALGLSVLRNRHVSIGDAGASFDLVGVDDWSGARRRGGQGYDLEAALAGRDSERAAVLLAHQPRNFEAAVERGIGLQISGHTHGGQLFPFTELVGLGYDYVRGLYQHGDGHIYVSRGCGFWGPPARLGSEPEIVRYVLTS